MRRMLLAITLLALPSAAVRGADALGLFNEPLPGGDPAANARLTTVLREASFEVRLVDAATACDPRALTPAAVPLYVIPNARTYPAEGYAALAAYIRAGGKLVLLGAPAFANPVWRTAERWVDRAAITAELARVVPTHVLVDLERERSLDGWSRATNDPAISATLTHVQDAPEGGGTCLALATERLTGWLTYASPPLEGMFPAGHELLCMAAKGDARTPQLAIELNERDGSRWIAVIALEARWKRYALRPQDFRYWADSPTGPRRGGHADRFAPANAVRIVLGLSQSHTQAVDAGPHTLRVACIGTAPNPFGGIGVDPARQLPPIESVWPAYKVYPLRDIAAVTPVPEAFPGRDAPALPVPASAFAAFARPAGKGFGVGAPWRWLRLLDAHDARGVWRGSPGWILLDTGPAGTNAIVACLGSNDEAILAGDAYSRLLAHTVRRISHGIFLREAGAEHFAYFAGENVTLGAEALVAGSGGARPKLAVELTLRAEGGQKPRFSDFAVLDFAPGAATARMTSAPGTLPAGVYVATAKLFLEDEALPVDAISHELRVCDARTPASDEFVTVADGDFRLRGKRWHPVGVNFWPRYVAGLEAKDFGASWLTRGYYDPEEVERDLATMAGLGITMASIQLPGAVHMRNAVDFLRRCERHGIKVNAYLGAASPLDFRERAVRETIEAGQLRDDPALFAYDTIWEPGNWVFGAERRPSWDEQWRRWIDERYGSLANAERDWGRAAPRRNGAVTAPSDAELATDGPWRAMVAAYRRFMDDLMSRKWNDATRALRAIDPHHLVSFRQGNTLPHDFALTATVKHIDFICPEGYSIGPGADGRHAAGFITRFCNLTTGGKPIIWAEFGSSVWDAEAMQPGGAAVVRQGEYHQLFYDTVLAAGAHGTAPWWWPGGYRVDERSDFGICDPDGTPRPAAEHIAPFAARIAAARPAFVPDAWITIDRDAHAGGYWHLAFAAGKDAYAEALARGKLLGVRTAATGTTSATAPRLAVGNTPLVAANVPKHLNAEFNAVTVMNASGKWQDAPRDGRITVAPETPVRLRVSVGNTQEAAWLTPQEAHGDGGVFLVSTADSELAVRLPLPARTPYLADADFGEFTLADRLERPARVVLRMEAAGIARFGEARAFTLVPAR